MKAQFEALGATKCVVCDGYGHAYKDCVTYDSILEFVQGNPTMQSYWRRSLETIVGPRVTKAMKTQMMRKRLKSSEASGSLVPMNEDG